MGLWSRFRLLFATRASSALDRAEDPRQVLDYAYSQQQQLLVNLRRGLVDVRRPSSSSSSRLRGCARTFRGLTTRRAAPSAPDVKTWPESRSSESAPRAARSNR